ncbi:MAG: DNA polymerase IV (EC [uncultured Sulfurovum sp.]|uniref:DNA polymerase IV (EC) n=1 Tax=uncultured Sulfurovum sp. TaxID=269237 RepID=A0A6S6TR98_9BACT|nr:MAG: DNA polymerase IV (EC [uncultured Sulfurovum sp.]
MYLHIDIDSFFASAERSVNPSLEGIPIAVGSRSNLEIFNKKRTNIKLLNDNMGAFVTPVFFSSKKKTFESVFVDNISGTRKIRGIVTTSSYEARAFGIKTAMPIAQALQLCPHLVVIPSNYPFYHQVSKDLTEYMKKKIPKIEQFSIDEFFGDLSGWIKEEECYNFAMNLKNEIFEHFKIPVSIGIAPSKWIAKVATNKAKPFGVYQVQRNAAFIKSIPIEAFPGIGKAFQKRLKAHNIHTLGEIEANKELFYTWKKPGIQLYNRVLGIDNEFINEKSPRKSIGISRTFDAIHNKEEVRRRVVIMARHIIYLVLKHQVNPTTYYLSLNYEFGINRKASRTLHRLFSETLFKSQLLEMYDQIVYQNSGAIKLTINVSNFNDGQGITMSLFDFEEDAKKAALSKEIQSLRDKFGLDILKSGVEL